MTYLVAQALFVAVAAHWIPQVSNSLAGLRGLSVPSSKVAWASGTNGTILRTVNGGEHWETLKVPGSEALDFRDVEAFDANSALVMASGNGGASKVFLTNDHGGTWNMVLGNPDSAGFFDAMKFWDRAHGILLGDPVAGKFTIFTTEDGGMHWQRRSGPVALAEEGAFAASGTCLTLLGNKDAWFGTSRFARVFHTADQGSNWTVSTTPLGGDTTSTGIFSMVFLDSRQGILTGGDYQQPNETSRTLALTRNGGLTWTTLGGFPGGFRSGAVYVRPRAMLIVVGTNGGDYSSDGGTTWQRFSTDNLNAVAGNGTNVYAVGPKGLIVKMIFHQP